MCSSQLCDPKLSLSSANLTEQELFILMVLQELERRVELAGRNRAQEVKSLLQRNKGLAHEVDELKEYTEKMHIQLRVC